ncbi:TetR/AcrR family transcriptional regulator [Verrucomicrobiales bacterium BCK34]|nr:TetR/AcrR family transcriptional regulator [Verrucomicrobiales bacterium BCK34]
MARKTTKELILDAAMQVFATKEFHVATLGEICEIAGANCAAGNYHFGSKEALLNEAISHAFEIADSRYPLSGGVDASAAPEDRLRAFMAAIISRSFDPGPAGYFERIIGHVLSSSSGERDEAFSKIREAHEDVLLPLLSEMIEFRDEAQRAQAGTAIIALCVFQNVAPGCREDLFPDGPEGEPLQHYIEDRTRFALAGLSAYPPAKLPCVK